MILISVEHDSDALRSFIVNGSQSLSWTPGFSISIKAHLFREEFFYSLQYFLQQPKTSPKYGFTRADHFRSEQSNLHVRSIHILKSEYLTRVVICEEYSIHVSYLCLEAI